MSLTAPLAFTFARRELRSGVAGFRVFLACLALADRLDRRVSVVGGRLGAP